MQNENCLSCWLAKAANRIGTATVHGDICWSSHPWLSEHVERANQQLTGISPCPRLQTVTEDDYNIVCWKLFKTEICCKLCMWVCVYCIGIWEKKTVSTLQWGKQANGNLGTHTHEHTYTHTCIHTHTHAYIHIRMHTYIHRTPFMHIFCIR